jgi:hypothetical protein
MESILTLGLPLPMRAFQACVLGFIVSLPTFLYSDIEGVPTPGVILCVTDVDTPGGASILHRGGLQEGVSAFHDRPGQFWEILPPELIGADFIESAQNNADVTDMLGTTLEIDVQVVEGTILHMFIADSIGIVPFPWMNEGIFGADWIDSDENVEGSRGTFSVWSTDPLAGNAYVFRQQPVDGSFYGIAATFSDPSYIFSNGLEATTCRSVLR